MKSVLTKLSAIKRNPNNPRILKDDKFVKLTQSIKDFPQMLEIRPIVVNEDMIVLGGNMRLKACKEAGLKEVPVIKVSDLTEEQQREFIIKDNIGFGEWDWDLLANEWDTDLLDEWGLDLDFDPTDDNEGLTDEDDVPEVPEEPVSKVGDIWLLDNHRVMCGDSTNGGDVALLMNGEKAQLLHADPPYGMGKEGDGVANDNLYREKLDEFQMDWWKAFRPAVEDNGSAYIWGNAEDLWRLWYSGGLKNSERFTMRNEIVWNKKHGQGMRSEQHRMYPNATERCLFFMLGEQGFNNNADNYWDGWDFMVNYLKQEKDKSGLTIKELKRLAGHSENSGCHWFDKSQWMMPTEETYNSWRNHLKGKAFKREYDAFKREYDDLKREYDDLKREFYGTRAYFENSYDNMIDVWEFDRVHGNDRHGHATPKPVEMMERVMKSSLPKDGLCIEPFGGSGSTLIGAEKTNRKCYTMELQGQYVDVIVKRWQEYTGKKAIHAETGEQFVEVDNGKA